MLDSGLRITLPFLNCVYGRSKGTYAQPKALSFVIRRAITKNLVVAALLLHRLITVNTSLLQPLCLCPYALNQKYVLKYVKLFSVDK